VVFKSGTEAIEQGADPKDADLFLALRLAHPSFPPGLCGQICPPSLQAAGVAQRDAENALELSGRSHGPPR
jgi:hypothetical protein